MPAGRDPAGLSPYQVVLGDAVDDLAPSLRRYFSAIPPGSVGVGRGEFEVVGTPRRWLWPILAIVGRGGAMFPVWEHGVPFDVVNRPVVADGRPGITAVRTFHLRSGSRDMVDLITAVPRGGRPQLLDLLGRGRTLLVLLDAEPEDDGLHVTSPSSALRLGPLRVRMPAFFRPHVEVRERRGADGRQHLSLTIDLPLIGRIYEYAGAFDYEIVPDRGQDRGGA
jgi:hypothetical protein